MAEEDVFVQTALKAARKVLGPPLLIERKVALLYQIAVDNRLNVRVNTKSPTRGQSAFETDLCVLEQVENDLRLPRVVLEFKKQLTTHDVLTYSAKATKHKQIYPYLRYGLVISGERALPTRFFRHNEGLDSAIAAKSYNGNRLYHLFEGLLRDEVNASRQLERIAFDKHGIDFYRKDIIGETRRQAVV
jgi:hypothetical protein